MPFGDEDVAEVLPVWIGLHALLDLVAAIYLHSCVPFR